MCSATYCHPSEAKQKIHRSSAPVAGSAPCARPQGAQGAQGAADMAHTSSSSAGGLVLDEMCWVGLVSLKKNTNCLIMVVFWGGCVVCSCCGVFQSIMRMDFVLEVVCFTMACHMWCPQWCKQNQPGYRD